MCQACVANTHHGDRMKVFLMYSVATGILRRVGLVCASAEFAGIVDCWHRRGWKRKDKSADIAVADISHHSLMVAGERKLQASLKPALGCRGAGFHVGGRRQEVTAKYQAQKIISFPWESRRRQVGRGRPVEGVRRVRAGLQQARFLHLRAKACILGGFVEDVGNRNGYAVAGNDTGTDGGMVTRRSRTSPHKEHCWSWSRKSDAQAVLHGGTCEIGVPVEER